MRGILTAATMVVTVVVLAGCNGQQASTSASSSSSPPTSTSTTTESVPRRSPLPAPVPAPTVPSTETGPVPAAGPGCDVAPAAIVDMVNASFTNGEHLANAQSVTGPSGMVIVGGNIVDPDGTRVSSSDSWVMSGGTVYGLSSDARRHTLLADGRDVLGDNWTTYNDAVGECVQQATRAANG